MKVVINIKTCKYKFIPDKDINVFARMVTLVMAEHVKYHLHAVRLFLSTVQVKIDLIMISSVLIHMIIMDTKLTRAEVTKRMIWHRG